MFGVLTMTAFVFGVIFGAKEPNFPIFLFIGITMWDFFSKTVNFSVKAVKNRKAVVSKVYLPKYILIIEKMFVNAFKMLISMGIVALMLIFYKVDIGWNIIYMPFILFTLFLFTFAVSVHLEHFGVYVEDLANVVRIVLRFLVYMTGIFYNIETRLGEPWGSRMLKMNPLAAMITAMRKCVLYDTCPNRKLLLVILAGSILLAAWGIKRIYTNENSYAKVI